MVHCIYTCTPALAPLHAHTHTTTAPMSQGCDLGQYWRSQAGESTPFIATYKKNNRPTLHLFTGLKLSYVLSPLNFLIPTVFRYFRDRERNRRRSTNPPRTLSHWVKFSMDTLASSLRSKFIRISLNPSLVYAFRRQHLRNYTSCLRVPLNPIVEMNLFPGVNWIKHFSYSEKRFNLEKKKIFFLYSLAISITDPILTYF